MSTIIEMISTGGFPADFSNYVDVESGLRRVGGNQAVYIKLIKSYLSSDTVTQLKNQIELGDFEGAAMMAHGIKGVSGNLSLILLYETVIKLESRLKQGMVDEAVKKEFLLISEKTQEYLQLLIKTSE